MIAETAIFKLTIAPIAEGSCKMYAVVHKSTPLTSLFYRLPSWTIKTDETEFDRIVADFVTDFYLTTDEPLIIHSEVFRKFAKAIKLGRPAIIEINRFKFYLVEFHEGQPAQTFDARKAIKEW